MSGVYIAEFSRRFSADSPLNYLNSIKFNSIQFNQSFNLGFYIELNWISIKYEQAFIKGSVKGWSQWDSASQSWWTFGLEDSRILRRISLRIHRDEAAMRYLQRQHGPERQSEQSAEQEQQTNTKNWQLLQQLI